MRHRGAGCLFHSRSLFALSSLCTRMADLLAHPRFCEQRQNDFPRGPWVARYEPDLIIYVSGKARKHRKSHEPGGDRILEHRDPGHSGPRRVHDPNRQCFLDIPKCGRRLARGTRSLPLSWLSARSRCFCLQPARSGLIRALFGPECSIEQCCLAAAQCRCFSRRHIVVAKNPAPSPDIRESIRHGVSAAAAALDRQPQQWPGQSPGHQLGYARHYQRKAEPLDLFRSLRGAGCVFQDLSAGRRPGSRARFSAAVFVASGAGADSAGIFFLLSSTSVLCDAGIWPLDVESRRGQSPFGADADGAPGSMVVAASIWLDRQSARLQGGAGARSERPPV